MIRMRKGPRSGAQTKGWVVGLFVFFVATQMAMAQLPTATILGEVKDSTGAVVPGANLSARNLETGQTRRATSGNDGAYRFSALPVGTYEVRVEQPGFQSAVRTGLTLTVGREAVVDFELSIGRVAETVTVTGRLRW